MQTSPPACARAWPNNRRGSGVAIGREVPGSLSAPPVPGGRGTARGDSAVQYNRSGGCQADHEECQTTTATSSLQSVQSSGDEEGQMPMYTRNLSQREVAESAVPTWGSVGPVTRIRKISIFDFDGTLFLTPEPEAGRVEYEKLTGRPWPFQGWWGRRESLLWPLPTYAGPALDSFRREILDTTCVVVMLTGRRTHFRDIVEGIMRRAGIAPHRSLFNTAGDTLSFKLETVSALLTEFSAASDIEMWEDRPEHASAFTTFGASLAPRVHMHVNLVSSPPTSSALVPVPW